MKKLTSLVLALALGLGLAACGATANGPGAAGTFTTVEDGKLIMTTNAEFPPYEMTNDAGEFEGIDVEIAGAIAEHLGLTLQIDNMDFDNALIAVQEGRSDIAMAGITVNEERLAVMDFSDSYAEGVQAVILPEGSDIASLDDMQGKTIGVQRGTTGEMFSQDDFGADNVISFDNGAIAVQNMLSGKVDCVVIDNAPAQAYVAANPGTRLLDTAGQDDIIKNYAIGVPEHYAIGFDKGNTALVDAVNGALADLTADGTVQAIIDKYISAE